MMRAILKLTHPSGVDVELDVLDAEIGTLDTLVHTLLTHGYRPRAGAWPKGPSGAPLCLKHGGIEMQTRERQGDVWYSHKIVTGQGEEWYCRGVPYGPKAQDGYHH
jgi:hypothetical protein